MRIAIVTLLLLAASPYAAAAELPRTADGHPDLNGIWQVLNEANHGLERHTAAHAPMLRDGPRGPLPAAEVLQLGATVAVPPGLGVIRGGGPLPYTADAQAKRERLRADWVNTDPEVKCYMPGVPRATYLPYPFQIFQGAGDVFIAYQFAGAVREIYMEDPGEAPIDAWMGWSHGYWEDDTLVVEVTGLHDGTWLDRTGSHHSSRMRVVERYTMTSPDHIRYEATIEDPEVFTEPFTIEMPLYRRMEPGLVLLEFKCVEFVEELLYGAWRRTPLPRPATGEQP